MIQKKVIENGEIIGKAYIAENMAELEKLQIDYSREPTLFSFAGQSNEAVIQMEGEDGDIQKITPVFTKREYENIALGIFIKQSAPAVIFGSIGIY